MTASTLEAAGWFAVSLVTLLGDPLVIVGFGLGVFWLGDRLPGARDRHDSDRGAVLLASIGGALVLTVVLKTGLAIERPADATALPGVARMPEVLAPLYTWIVGPGGYAFPSGHAVGSAVGWLGLAWAVRPDDRSRWLLAGGLVAAVAASRVALGVHRPVEVAVGIALGVAYLLLTIGVLQTPRRAFALAGVIGTIGTVAVGLTGDGLLSAGIALGTATGWEVQRGKRRFDPTLAVGTTAIAGLLMVAATCVRFGGAEMAVAIIGITAGVLFVVARQ